MELDEFGGLVVVAPRHWSRSYIDATLSQNTSRIERFLIRARQRKLEPLQFVSGELHFYLGQRYPLRIDNGTGTKTAVVFNREEIRVHSAKDDPELVRNLLHGWYRLRASEVLSTRMRLVADRAAWVRDTDVTLRFRRMKRTWGNCSSKGVIKLNTHLIKAPLAIIDAVIAHELCHLQEMNHGKAFYRLLEDLNPDWRQDRQRLRSEGSIYLL
jgi:predicted metal-dependent hydrolase